MKLQYFFIITLITQLLVFNSIAQSGEPVETIGAGTKFIAGSFSISSSSNENEYGYGNYLYTYNRFSFGIGPTYATYFKDNLAWGVSLSYSLDNQKQTQPQYDVKSISNGVSLSVFLLKNYRIVNNLYFEVEPRISMGRNWQTSKSQGLESKLTGLSFGLGISPGLTLFLNDQFGLRTSLGHIGYNYARSSNSDNESKNSYNGFNLSGGFSAVNFSLRYYLP